MQRGRSGSIEKFWNPISTCLVCVPGLHHPRSVKIDLEKFDFEKGVVVDDDGEKKKYVSEDEIKGSSGGREGPGLEPLSDSD